MMQIEKRTAPNNSSILEYWSTVYCSIIFLRAWLKPKELTYFWPSSSYKTMRISPVSSVSVMRNIFPWFPIFAKWHQSDIWVIRALKTHEPIMSGFRSEILLTWNLGWNTGQIQRIGNDQSRNRWWNPSTLWSEMLPTVHWNAEPTTFKPPAYRRAGSAIAPCSTWSIASSFTFNWFNHYQLR